jgi:hypothetical protein
MDWAIISGLWGVLLPPFIEMFSKKVTGQAKILVVFTSCLIAAVITTGIDGGFIDWNWGQFGASAVIILTLSTNLWKQMWKKWFPQDPDPIEGHPQDIIQNELKK